jgi:hypothetical protein
VSATEPIVLTAEEIARELAWRLSNSNAEIETSNGLYVDIAYDTDRVGNVVALFVSSSEPDSGRRGMQRFRLVVEAASVAGPAGTGTPDGETR